MCSHRHESEYANIQVYEKIVIRKNGGEWEEPLITED